MKTAETNISKLRRTNFSCRIQREWVNLAVVGLVFIGSVTSSLAGYVVKTQIESVAGQNRYTWTVHNENESWGLDQFVIDVPIETHVLSHTVPSPYANPNGDAYWVMWETRDAQIDPNNNKAWLSAAKPGRKWIVWGGVEPVSVYPPGSTATFSLTTDDSVRPGTILGTATTYTPQKTPSYYAPFSGEVIGPSVLAKDTTSFGSTEASLPTMESRFQSAFFTNMNLTSGAGQAVNAANLSIGLYPGLTIEGVAGQTYGIQYATDLGGTNVWNGLTNVTLTVAKLTWFDPQSASTPKRYYRIVPGPISIP